MLNLIARHEATFNIMIQCRKTVGIESAPGDSLMNSLERAITITVGVTLPGTSTSLKMLVSS